MSEANLVIKLIQEAPNGYVPLAQLKQSYHDKYGTHLKRNKILKWIINLPGVYIDSNPVKNSVHIGANSGLTHHAPTVEGVQSKEGRVPPVAEVRTHKHAPSPDHPHHHVAIVKTLKSQDGRIPLHAFKKEYKSVTNNIPPYPEKGVRKWILSVEGVQIKKKNKKEVVQLMSMKTDPKLAAPKAQQRKDLHKIFANFRKVPKTKRNKGKKEETTKAKANSPSDDLPTKARKAKVSSPWAILPTLIPTPIPTHQIPKKQKQKRLKAKVQSSQSNLPIRNDCYYGMANHKADTEGNQKCIMHFGSTSDCKSWPGTGKSKGKEKKRLYRVSNGGSFSRAIVSGYMANKIKKSGGQKAARKARNLARLRKKHNPTPAAPTSHAIQRYKERGSHSSPIYKPSKGGKKAIVVTYVPIQRKFYSDAKKSSRTIQLEVDRMSQLSKKSDLPKSKLSSRDAYLFKLSSRAAKKEECRRRSQQKERAYSSKWITLSGRRKDDRHGQKSAGRSRKKPKKRKQKKKVVLERLALERKEDLQIAIEEKQEMGVDGLEEDDKYLMKIGGCRGMVNLDDLKINTTSAEHQASWLQSVEAARNALYIRGNRKGNLQGLKTAARSSRKKVQKIPT
eukprot:scaffold5408_cov129-Skeletonema_dohrnii-CCMP3373.AAC.11